MTLADWNERRRALTRLERAGWLNHRINLMRNYAAMPDGPDKSRLCVEVTKGCYTAWLPIGPYEGETCRAYRRKYKFWECI